MRILLIDDEEKFVLMLARRLTLRGFKVEAFFSGRPAIEVVRRGGRFDVAVLDLKMPDIGGLELKKMLSRHDSRLKFVFLTGHGSTAVFSEEDPPTVCLSKPVQIDALITTLVTVTGKTPPE